MSWKFASVALVFLVHAANAADTNWQATAYKKSNPNELAYFHAIASECPISDERAKSLIEGVFVRSRIKPLPSPHFVDEKVYMNINVSCLELKAANPVYSTSVRFGNYSESIPVLFDEGFGNFGIGPKSSVEKSVKEAVEKAITEYLKANFDLGE